MMSKRVPLFIALAAVAVAIVAAACGGTDTPEPTSTTAVTEPTQAPTSTPETVEPEPTTAATSEPDATPTSVANTPTPQVVEAESTPTPEPPPSGAGDSGTGRFDWTFETIDEGIKPTLALAPDGTVHVAYIHEHTDGYIRNAVKTDLGWDISTIVDGYYYGPLDLIVDQDGVPHVTYHDHQDPSLFDPKKGDLAHAFVLNGEWEVEHVFDPGHDGWDSSITVDRDGRLHVAAIDPEEYDGQGMEYYRENAPGDWTVESVPTGLLDYKFATRIAIDPAGNPHVTYYDFKAQTLNLASRDDSGWTTSVIGDSGGTGLFSSFVIDDAGRFHVSYFRRDVNEVIAISLTGGSGAVMYATKGPDEDSWEITEVSLLDKMKFGHVAARNVTSLALDADGNPWIVYSNEEEISLAVWDGSEWTNETFLDISDQLEGQRRREPLGQQVSFKLDSEGNPHLAYFIKSGLVGHIWYAQGIPR